MKSDLSSIYFYFI